jgi:hypothetical protein
MFLNNDLVKLGIKKISCTVLPIKVDRWGNTQEYITLYYIIYIILYYFKNT